MSRPNYRHRTLRIFGLLTLAATGCSDEIVRYPVTGSVLVDGKAAEGAMVILCPIGGSEQLMRERPFGMTGPNGDFLLTTLDKDDGAPAGDYKVLVQWLTPPQAGEDRDRGSGQTDRLRGRYMNLDRSTISATVNDEATDLPPFELKSK